MESEIAEAISLLTVVVGLSSIGILACLLFIATKK
jgi:hypothetical protein